jgi:hypothetical protein
MCMRVCEYACLRVSHLIYNMICLIYDIYHNEFIIIIFYLFVTGTLFPEERLLAKLQNIHTSSIIEERFRNWMRKSM